MWHDQNPSIPPLPTVLSHTPTRSALPHPRTHAHTHTRTHSEAIDNDRPLNPSLSSKKKSFSLIRISWSFMRVSHNLHHLHHLHNLLSSHRHLLSPLQNQGGSISNLRYDGKLDFNKLIHFGSFYHILV